jgi:predicted DNA-binding transcriptional regulator AlpA
MTTEDYSVRRWCKRRGICVATFYNRLKFGEMPNIIKIGRRTIITAEADEAWRRRMEALAAGKLAPSGEQP